VYVLVAPAQSASRQSGQDSAAALRAALARDAVRVEAQPAGPQQWWNEQPTCIDPETAPTATPGATGVLSGRIVYDRADNVARDLSERMVALANSENPRLAAAVPEIAGQRSLRVAGLDGPGLARTLAGGSETAYVLALPVHVADRCREARVILTRAPWLGGEVDGLADRILALVETRARAIVRRGALGITVDWLGDIDLTPEPHRAPVTRSP
jgi:hypothetical protein